MKAPENIPEPFVVCQRFAASVGARRSLLTRPPTQPDDKSAAFAWNWASALFGFLVFSVSLR